MQADLHVHSRHSTRPSQWFLQKIGCPESFTEPLHLYHIARRRGMTLVTITDHNKIEGALEIAHLPGTFISEEVTSYFPEDGCKVHVLVYNITEAQHADIQRLRTNIFELVGYLQQAAITCAVAHPLYAVNDRLTPDHFEKLLLLFRIFELNGDSNPDSNRCLEEIAHAPDARRHRTTGGQAPPGSSMAGAVDQGLHRRLRRPQLPQHRPQLHPGAGRRLGSRVPGRNRRRAVLKPFRGRRRPRTWPTTSTASPTNSTATSWTWGQQVPHDFLLRYVDRSLRCTGEEDTGLLSRLHLLWHYPRLRKIKGSIPGPLVDLLKKESSRLIAEEPDLFVLPQKGDRISQRLEDRWFQFINKMSNRILVGFANHLMDHFSGANLFSIFHTIGSAGGFCTLLAPYFVGFAHHNEQRKLARSVMARL